MNMASSVNTNAPNIIIVNLTTVTIIVEIPSKKPFDTISLTEVSISVAATANKIKPYINTNTRRVPKVQSFGSNKKFFSFSDLVLSLLILNT